MKNLGALKMARWDYSRRAVALVFLCGLALTVAAEATLKNGTRVRMSNQEVQERLQVGMESSRTSHSIKGFVVISC